MRFNECKYLDELLVTFCSACHSKTKGYQGLRRSIDGLRDKASLNRMEYPEYTQDAIDKFNEFKEEQARIKDRTHDKPTMLGDWGESIESR